MNFSKIKQQLPTLALVGTAVVMAAAPAHAEGLSNAKSVLDSFLSELKTIVPVAATIALILLAVGYAAKMVEKDTLIRWGIGIIVAGSAGTLAAALFSGA
jgi:hypothetical protein